MALVLPWPSIRQAVIRSLRHNLVLQDQLPGDWSEGVAPKDTPYPLGVIQLAFAPKEFDWTGFIAVVGFDTVVFSKDSGEAARLDQIVFTTLHNQRLDVTGQSILKVVRTSDLSLSDVDASGDPIYSMGGSYQVMAAQSNPTLQTLTVTLDATIS